jgi:hypothetical protein
MKKISSFQHSTNPPFSCNPVSFASPSKVQPKVRVLITSLHESGASTQQIVCETFLEKCLFSSKGLFFLLVALYKSTIILF